MAGEAQIAARHPGWQITVLPPAGTPLRIPFAPGSAEPDTQALRPALWALKRWDTANVRVTGHAASRDDGRNPRDLALARATAVADHLTTQGLTATAEADPPGPRQRAAEVETGVAAFRIVTLQPAAL
jgi:flagellar motor protein MotB